MRGPRPDPDALERTTMAKRDYYETLGVDRSVTPDELKKAFRKAAMKYHPDRNTSDADTEQKFKEVAEAYEILSEPNKRALYDRGGFDAVDGGSRVRASSFEEIFSNFGDIFGAGIFEEFFGAGSRRRSGAHRRIHIEISLEEVAAGVEKVVEFSRLEICASCHGSCAEPGTAPEPCAYCHGYGQIEQRQGFFAMRQACPRCHGQGQVNEHPCRACRGRGATPGKARLSVRVPPGVCHGQRLVVRGEGDPGENGAPRGDL